MKAQIIQISLNTGLCLPNVCILVAQEIDTHVYAIVCVLHGMHFAGSLATMFISFRRS